MLVPTFFIFILTVSCNSAAFAKSFVDRPVSFFAVAEVPRVVQAGASGRGGRTIC